MAEVKTILYNAIMKDFQRILSTNVDRLRSQGESMERIAKRAGVTRPYLYMILRGESVPTLDRAEQIARGLGFRIVCKSS